MNKDLTITLQFDQSPGEVFNAVNNVTKWWIEEIKGHSSKLNDEFSVQFFVDVHYSKQKLVEFVPDKKVVWLITDSKLYFLKNKQEWTNTKVVFDISQHDNKTILQFTHIGLTPAIECYKDCTNGWNQYIGSLYKLITTGKGEPEKMVEQTQQQV